MNDLMTMKPLQELNWVLDRMMNNPFRLAGTADEFAPGVDIYATKDEFVVLANLPGASGENIEVTATKDQLVIQGEIKATNLPEGSASLLRERLAGKFKRVFTLPVEINASNISATFKDGVLEVHLPKSEAVKPQTVKVTVQ